MSQPYPVPIPLPQPKSRPLPDSRGIPDTLNLISFKKNCFMCGATNVANNLSLSMHQIMVFL